MPTLATSVRNWRKGCIHSFFPRADQPVHRGKQHVTVRCSLQLDRATRLLVLNDQRRGGCDAVLARLVSLANDGLLHRRVTRSAVINEVLSIFEPRDRRITSSSSTVRPSSLINELDCEPKSVIASLNPRALSLPSLIARCRLMHRQGQMVPLKIHVWMLINPCFEVWEVILAVGAFQVGIFDDGETGITAPVNPSATLSLLIGCLRQEST